MLSRLANDQLEFTFTLGIQINKPKPDGGMTKSASGFGKIFGSPKKQKLEAAAAFAGPKVLEGVIGRDGSFGRVHVKGKDMMDLAYGRPNITNLTAYNEWAVQQPAKKVSKGTKPLPDQLQARRLKPYPIAALEVVVCFIPGIYSLEVRSCM